MPSSQHFLTAIERPRCSRCQTRMMLERVSLGPIGFEDQLFECPKCDHVEMRTWYRTIQIECGGLARWELRAPN